MSMCYAVSLAGSLQARKCQEQNSWKRQRSFVKNGGLQSDV